MRKFPDGWMDGWTATPRHSATATDPLPLVSCLLPCLASPWPSLLPCLPYALAWKDALRPRPRNNRIQLPIQPPIQPNPHKQSILISLEHTAHNATQRHTPADLSFVPGPKPKITHLKTETKLSSLHSVLQAQRQPSLIFLPSFLHSFLHIPSFPPRSPLTRPQDLAAIVFVKQGLSQEIIQADWGKYVQLMTSCMRDPVAVAGRAGRAGRGRSGSWGSALTGWMDMTRMVLHPCCPGRIPGSRGSSLSQLNDRIRTSGTRREREDSGRTLSSVPLEPLVHTPSSPALEWSKCQVRTAPTRR
jgi:hypothetical protein